MNMKGKKMMACLLALALQTGVVAQEAPTSVGTLDLTLERAIEIALAENPTMKVADKEIELKKTARSEAWQSLLPTVDVSMNMTNNILVAEMVTGMGRFKMGVDGTVAAIGAASLNLPIFAPAVYQNIKLTKEDILSAQEKARGSRLDLVNQVTKAYFSALLAQDALHVMQAGYKIAKDNFDVVNAKYQFGSVSEYDKISAEVQMRTMNASLVSSQTGQTLSLLQLKVLMGVTEDVDIVINDSLQAYENTLLLADAEMVGNDLEGNSALRQLDYNISLLERSRKLLRTNFMPTIGLQLTGQYQSYANHNWNVFDYQFSPSATLAIAINIPIFHASNWTKMKTNRLQIEQLEETRRDTQHRLMLAAESYKKNMASSIAQVESNREAVNQATKAVSISQKRYEVGRGTILEVNQSQVALTQSQLTYSQSLYDYLNNRADLDYTLGRETYLK